MENVMIGIAIEGAVRGFIYLVLIEKNVIIEIFDGLLLFK